jgi:hypothetical protein
MKLTTLIAQHIIDVHQGGNWTEVDITITLQDVTLEEATMHTQASPNTIASLLNHITYWNRVMVQRAQGIQVQIDNTNGYDHPLLLTEEDWQDLKKDNLRSAHELATAITQFDEAKLFESILPDYSTAYKNFQGSVEHVHYHLGQIVILKKLIRNATE